MSPGVFILNKNKIWGRNSSIEGGEVYSSSINEISDSGNDGDIGLEGYRLGGKGGKRGGCRLWLLWFDQL